MQNISANVYTILKRVFLFLPFLVLVNLVFAFFTTDIDSAYKLNSFSLYYFAVSVLLGITPWLTHSLKIYIWCVYMKYNIPYLETVRIAIGSDLGPSERDRC